MFLSFIFNFLINQNIYILASNKLAKNTIRRINLQINIVLHIQDDDIVFLSLFTNFQLISLIISQMTTKNITTIKQIQGYTIYMKQILGSGSYGNVYRGINQQSKQLVAIKIIPKQIIDADQYLRHSLNNQIKILQSVNSNYIVRFHDFMESTNNYYIIQQLCDGDLSKIIKKNHQMPEKQCINILTQICEGFLALVKEGIIHRDLKPANVMTKANLFKIGDFGFSKKQQLSNSQSKNIKFMQSTVGTPLYMSLQILKGLRYTSKCDIWALGFIFYEMLHGKTPWTGNNQYMLIQNIQKGNLKFQRNDLSPQTIDFLKRCLKIYEQQRISWNQVYIHPIFKNKFLNMADENKQYQNKLKSIMTKLRFYFNLNKGNLQEFLFKHGYKNVNADLSFDKYLQFLRAVNPNITESQAKYIFSKTDTDNSGTISMDQIINTLQFYGIQIKQKVNKNKQLIIKKYDEGIISFFKKLYRIIERFQLTLKRVFIDFDKSKKGYLTGEQFKSMVKKMSKDISDEQIDEAFRLIDEDGSNSLQFAELNKHFQIINGIIKQ